jgi:tetratricopeptide (TPR) repeat protein
MNLKSIIPAILLTIFCLPAFAQDYKARFKELIAKDDTQATLNLLGKWQKATPNDPEMYVAYYNLYAKEGLKEVLSLTTKEPAGQAFQLTDKNGKTAGYLGSSGGHNDAYLDKGFKYIDTAITKFPTRLDMRFGKAYVLGRIGDFNNFTSEIVKAIDYGQTINQKWLWSNGKPLEEPTKFMLSTVQSYVVQLYNAGDNNADHIKAIAETVLKYYPDQVESLSNLSISYMIKKDYAGAINPLLKAEKVNPQDYIVLNNIAFCYSNMGDKPNAIIYYERTAKYGDEDAKKQATEKLVELRKD